MSRRIFLAASIWAASILGARVLGLVREAVLARTLGAGAETDAYWAAFLVPDFLNYLLAAGGLSIVFIPIFGAYLARGDESGAWEAFSKVANFLLMALVVLVAGAWLALPHLAGLVAPGFDSAGRERLVELTRIVLLAQPFHVLGGLMAAALQARDRHALAALAPVVYNLGIVAGGLVGGSAHGAEGFAWGVVAGSVLGPFLLPYLGCLRTGFRWRLSLELRSADLRAYLVRSLPIMLGFSIVVVDDWFLRREGSRLGPGSVSVLSYAKSLMRVPVGVVGLAAGAALYPTMVRLAGAGERQELKRTLLGALRPLVVLSLLCFALFLVAGPEIVSLVYGRGRIDPERATAISDALALVSIGLAAWTTQALFSRCFYAFGQTWPPVLVGTLAAAASYPLYLWLGARAGLSGLATASSIAISVYAIALAVLLEQRWLRLESAERRALGVFLLRSLAVLAASTGAGLLLGRAVPLASTFGATLARGALLVVASTAVFVGAGLALGLDEVRAALRLRWR